MLKQLIFLVSSKIELPKTEITKTKNIANANNIGLVKDLNLILK